MEDILTEDDEQDRVPLQKLKLLGNLEKLEGGGGPSAEAQLPRILHGDLSQSCASLHGLKGLKVRHPAFRHVSLKVYLQNKGGLDHIWKRRVLLIFFFFLFKGNRKN